MGSGILIFPAIDKPHVSLAAEKLFGSPISNSMLTMFLVMIALILFFVVATRRVTTGGATAAYAAPRGAQNFAEFVIESLLNLVEGTAGKKQGRVIFPLIATLFIFILSANYAGLLPGVGTIGYCEHPEGEHGSAALVASTVPVGGSALTTAAEEGVVAPGCNVAGEVLVPFLRAPNADLNMTIAMALIAVITVQFFAIRSHGVGSYLKEFIAPPIPLLHLIGEFSRIISLSARLFGNVFGGEVLLAVIIALTTPLAFGLAGVVPMLFYGLELFFGFIQALLFSLLTLIYIAVASAGGHGDHGEHHEEHGALGTAERQLADLAA
ncbi:MAG TPA: F0F1 ATP synthase subunit A [Thermomicrobiales bacterium]|jgi:F-type H+-transporting ATPase subunit a